MEKPLLLHKKRMWTKVVRLMAARKQRDRMTGQGKGNGKKGEREEDERQRQRQRQERSKKETWNFRQVYHPKVCFC